MPIGEGIVVRRREAEKDFVIPGEIGGTNAHGRHIRAQIAQGVREGLHRHLGREAEEVKLRLEDETGVAVLPDTKLLQGGPLGPGRAMCQDPGVGEGGHAGVELVARHKLTVVGDGLVRGSQKGGKKTHGFHVRFHSRVSRSGGGKVSL